jgi:hypothetical protein
MAQKEVAFKIIVDTEQVFPEIENIKKEIDELRKANEKMAQDIKNGFKSAEQGAKGASSGIAGIGSSIGSVIKSLGVLGAALAVFEFLRDLLMKNQRIVDLFGKSLKTVEIVFGRVTKAVEDLIDSLKELKNFDIRKIAEQFTNFGKALADSTDGALDLAEKVIKMEKAVAKAEATQRLYALTLQTEIEKQRQIRDDISLTIAKRQEANDKIAVLIDQQLKGEQALANKKLELALIEKDIANNNEESQIKVIEARTELKDIEERLTGVLSEQKTNREALRNEEDQRLEELLVNYEGALEYLRNLDINGEFDAQIQANLQAQLDAQEEYKIALDGMRQYLKENNEGMTADQIENHSQMIAIQEAYEKKLTKIAKDSAEIRRAAQISAAVAVSSALGSINQLMLQQGQENTVAAKTLGIAQIAIDTATAISGAITAATKSGNTWEMIAGIAAGVAAVISAVGQATSIINGVNIGGGTAATPSASSVTAAAAPSFNPVTTNTTELGNTQAAELAPIQAFVVETQLTESQFNINQIESQATFGGEAPFGG